MSTLDDWMQDAADALSLSRDQVPVGLRDELLDLTRDVAHGVARIAGPLTCYLAGVAVGRGAPPSTALSVLTDLVRTRTGPDAADAPTGPGEPAPGRPSADEK